MWLRELFGEERQNSIKKKEDQISLLGEEFGVNTIMGHPEHSNK